LSKITLGTERENNSESYNVPTSVWASTTLIVQLSSVYLTNAI